MCVSAYIPHIYVLSNTFEKSRSEISVGEKPIGEKPLAEGQMGENSVTEKHMSLSVKNLSLGTDSLVITVASAAFCSAVCLCYCWSFRCSEGRDRQTVEGRNID